MTCAKQIVTATIKNNGSEWVGTNHCDNPMQHCPRKSMKSGEGYELCLTVCKQSNHAEVNACIAAGEKANGGILFLEGHSYCCDNCLRVIEEYGIKEVIFP